MFERVVEKTGHKALDDRSFAIRLMEHLVVPTFVIDKNARVIVWNKACERLTGIPAAEVLGTSNQWMGFYEKARPCLADLLARGDYDSIGSHYSQWDGFGMSDFGISVENWCVMPRVGHRRYLAIDAGPIYDESGALIAVVETLRDVTSQHEARSSLQSLAAEDPLTGLPNRRTFDESLKAELKSALRTREPLSLLMIDVDCFKSFNDTYGHQSGDQCLRSVAKAMAEVLHRKGDMVARYGGEEFVVILPRTGADDALTVAERIRTSIQKLAIPHRASQVCDVVTASIGTATGQGEDFGADRLLGAADSALYSAKHDGRNRSSAAQLENSLTLF